MVRVEVSLLAWSRPLPVHIDQRFLVAEPSPGIAERNHVVHAEAAVGNLAIEPAQKRRHGVSDGRLQFGGGLDGGRRRQSAGFGVGTDLFNDLVVAQTVFEILRALRSG
jgi:hypothetical protein